MSLPQAKTTQCQSLLPIRDLSALKQQFEAVSCPAPRGARQPVGWGLGGPGRPWGEGAWNTPPGGADSKASKSQGPAGALVSSCRTSVLCSSSIRRSSCDGACPCETSASMPPRRISEPPRCNAFQRSTSGRAHWALIHEVLPPPVRAPTHPPSLFLSRRHVNIAPEVAAFHRSKHCVPLPICVSHPTEVKILWQTTSRSASHSHSLVRPRVRLQSFGKPGCRDHPSD